MAVNKKIEQVDLALNFARKGIEVFPTNRKKVPIYARGFLTATTNKKQIKEWWSNHKRALVAAPNTEYVVIDVDFKNVCEAGKMLTESTVRKLYETGIVTESTPKVVTPSGGFHFYFKRSKSLSRRIFILPNIDLLANNGYTVLPGQCGYSLTNECDNPWDVFDKLPELDVDKFDKLVESLTDVTKTASVLKKAYADKLKSASHSKLVTDAADASTTIVPRSTLNYKTNEIVFEQTPQMYTPSDKPDTEFEVMFDSEGFLLIDKFNQDRINATFHNRAIQERLASFLGVKVPRLGDKSRFVSIFPSHIDTNPSMGARWSRDMSHLVVRDFTNFYSDKYDQNDYNLVRLYVTCKHKTQAPKLKPPEFTVWFLRMLVDAGIVRHQPKQYGKSIDLLKNSERHVAEMFLLLDGCKSLYDGYNNLTTFSDRFAAAWCGVPLSTVNRCKGNLVERGYINTNGFYDCSGNEDMESFYKTPLYSVCLEEYKYKSPLFNRKEK